MSPGVLSVLRQEERLPALVAGLREEVARLAGVTAARIRPDQPLSRLGLDSLAAIELAHRVESRLGVVVDMSKLLDGTDLSSLGRLVLDQLGDALVTGEEPAGEATTPGEDASRPTHGQEALWFLHRLAPESRAYHITAAARVAPAPDVRALGRAVEALSRHHAALTSTFHDVGGRPVVRVDRSALPEVEEVDARRWSAEQLRGALQGQADRPFDLASGPLLRLTVFRRAAGEEDVLLLVVHHIIADFWTLSILSRELGDLYDAPEAERRPPRRAPLDFARLERQRLEADGEHLWAYWQRRLCAPLPVLELPTDRPRPPVQSWAGAVCTLSFDAGLTEAVSATSQEHGATRFTVLLAGFAAALHRSADQRDVLLGFPVAGRDRAEWAEVVGYFAGPVVLRSELGRRSTFHDFLGATRQSTVEALAHRDFPFPLLVERLQAASDPSRSPLFQAMFVFLETPPGAPAGLLPFALGEVGGQIELGGLTAKSMTWQERWSPFDLTLRMAEVDGCLVASLLYNRDLFDGTSMRRLLGHFRRLIRGAVAEPRRPVEALSLLAAGERAQLLAEWNDPGRRTAGRRPADRGLYETFAAQAARTPERVALVTEDESVSYGGLAARASRLAAILRARGVGPEVRVGVCLERSPAMIVSLLAIHRAGGAYVPLDPAYPRERLEFMLVDSGARILVTRDRFGEFRRHQALRVAPEAEPDSAAAPESLPLAPSLGSLAYVIYTSGSTGRPKGVAISHGSAVELVDWAGGVFGPRDLAGVLASTSICFDLSVFEIFVPLAWGGRVVLARDALALPELQAAGRVTFVNTVPSAMSVLASRELPADLRVVGLAGEPLEARLVEAVYAHRQVRAVWNLYGPSEDTTYSTSVRIGRRRAGQRVTIGQPLPGSRAYVVDSRHELLPIGTPGELALGGPGLARGYLGRPALTAERFVPDPFGGGGERLYKTGDLASWLPQKELFFLGRIDHQVKVRGFRVELGEVESVLARLPGVSEAAVAARDSETLVAYVVSAAGDQEPALRDAVSRRLPSYMAPSHYVFLDTMPQTPSGKLDRKALPAPKRDAERPMKAPETPAEQLLAEMFSDMLGLERAGMEESFFDLGGHSLLATRLLSRVRDTFQVELPVRTVFENPTLAGLMRAVTVREAWPGRTELIAGILQEVRSMSEVELRRVLREARGET